MEKFWSTDLLYLFFTFFDLALLPGIRAQGIQRSTVLVFFSFSGLLGLFCCSNFYSSDLRYQSYQLSSGQSVALKKSQYLVIEIKVNRTINDQEEKKAK